MVELKFGERVLDLPYMIRVSGVTDAKFDRLVDEDTKAELIDGVMYVHSPASLRHDEVADFFRGLMRPFVKRRKLGSVFGPDSLVRFGRGRRYGPDCYFLKKGRLPRGARPKEFAGVPELMAEVLSPSNRDHDLEVKRPRYQKAGVPEIWLIDPDKEEVQVDYIRGNRYMTSTYDRGRVESKVIPGFWINVDWLWPDELPDDLDCLREILGENVARAKGAAP
jgi:Uma2 family endonuclease